MKQIIIGTAMKGTIQSLERGLKIMTILGTSDLPLSLNEIATHFTMDRSSVFRLLSTLLKNGFVQQDEETKKYTLGFKFAELAGAFSEQRQIEYIIRPLMLRICSQTKQNTHLAVLDDADVVFIAVEQPRDSVSINISIGTREPSTATALGKALLSFSGDEVLEKILASVSLKKYTEKTIISRKTLRGELERIKQDRVAYDVEEYKSGIICVAAPIFNFRKEVIFSIGISGPSNLIHPHLQEFTEIIKNAGIEASMKYGDKPIFSDR
jgi:IclR family transcriptional regulator, KDG regulon repressor